MIKDTIVAQATASGKSGINIVRMSGSDSLGIAKKIFTNKNFNANVEPNKMYFGKVNLGDLNDNCFCVFFKGPKSFTGEDTIEFQCHGGFVVCKKIIEQCLSFGARLSTPGEFSKRAFLNGKISLDQAEGIIDIINSETDSQLKAARDLTKGELFKIVSSLQEKLTDIMSEIEVNLDFPEHDIEYETKENIKKSLEKIEEELKQIIKTNKVGQLIKDGINIAIVGKTNVGKSSLLNALINYEQAIVTDIEGTTRDVVSASIDYKGLKLCFYDTAGLRETKDVIEKIGIEKTKEVLKNCDIALYVFDASRKMTSEEKISLEEAKKSNSIIIFNKSDISSNIENVENAILISAKNKINIEELKEKIYNKAVNENLSEDKFILTNIRHFEILKEAKEMLINTIKNIEMFTLDCVALDCKTIWEKLGEITGKSASEIIIDKIFSKFCLGK